VVKCEYQKKTSEEEDMPELVQLEGSSSTIFAGACQIYSSFIRNGDVGIGEEEKYLKKSVMEAVRLAGMVNNETCSEDELCDDEKFKTQE
jgi:hypothetical protein